MQKKSFLSKSWILASLIIGLTGIVLFACTKYPDPAPYFENYDSTDVPLKRKVLLINVAGMSGPQIKEMQLPFIAEMLKHSKYSWKAMTDNVTTDAATWESLMTGLSVDDHQVRDSTFEIVPDDEHLEDNIPVYPTFLTRMRAAKPSVRMYAASPWQTLNQKLLANVDKLVNAANDKIVADSTVNELKYGKSDLLIADFNEVNIAGKTYGFSADTSQYVAAMKTVDGYVKAMVEAIESRPDYAEEQWLVILTSTHGGVGKSYGGSTLTEREIFTAYYNPHFEELNVPGQNYTQGVNFYKNKGEVADAGKYNIGETGDMTVMLRIKPSSFGSNNPAFLSKSDQSYGAGNHQWSMMFVGGSGDWRSYFVSTGGSQVYLSATKLTPNEWHTLAMKIYIDSGKRKAAVYTDGQFNNSVDITGKDFTTDATLKVGNIPGYGGGSCQELIQDIRIWDAAIPDSLIDSLSCNPDAIDLLSDYKADLTGYWPGNDGAGLVFKNRVSPGDDFELSDDSKWDLTDAFEGCVVKDDNGIPVLASIRNRDIAPQIFYWLRANVNTKWGWEGVAWLDRFESEFYKKKN